MEENFKTKIVVNPRSANGRTGKNWPKTEEMLRRHIPDFDYEFTLDALDATRITRVAIRKGYEMIVAMGGDGTINEVVNGFFIKGELLSESAVLGILPSGTGGDFRKTLGIPKETDAAAPFLIGKYTIPCDVGRAFLIGHDGREVDRCFINITSFGLGGLADRIVNSTTKAFGSKMSFFLGILRAELAYKNKNVHLEIDGKAIGQRKIKNVVVANAQYFGGGMRIAKDASISDGLLDIIVLGDFTTFDGIRRLRQLYNGTIVDFKEKVEYFQVREIKATAAEEVLIDFDGEQPGRLPITIRVMPRAIRLKTLPGDKIWKKL